ncbi:hypothetical protein CGZ93_12700 [Enemella dayhoffiae]|uniref:Uncharacterized protein n=1 Tax=Enemella dayhoffiae TaxID=2016507 RepID=A0A255GWQ3_9ACTN|nr:hypothetical protein [Enemella dayhoffiae]OYO19243.1 hypothetical protein CGZ93_12700 [Enemella dayhoffiae]
MSTFVALGLAVVLLGVLTGGGVWWYRQKSAPTTQATPVPTAAAPATPSAEQPSPTPSPSASTAPSTSPPSTTAPPPPPPPPPPTAPTGFPPGSSECTAGPIYGGVARSASGNKVTSCPFAEKVRQAYGAQPRRDGVVAVVATSPVTGSSYTMNCVATGLIVCTGGNDALVYLL